ncbi:hypothetical protein C2I36_09465 [Rhodobacteraceae bacterium WD3A24]|nr:hypothetical protein C2I36_09465 [Rhodobacteraceae bacterium WD3A24]
MQGMSQRQYARRAGISHTAVQKAVKDGRVVTFADGSIDAEASDARRAAYTDPSQQRGDQAAPTTEAPGPDALPGDGGGGQTTFLKARTMNEVLKAQERRLVIETKKGVLVDKARAEQLVFRLAREERDAWVNWPARVAAVMAAELSAAAEKNAGAEAAIDTATMQGVLERHVRKQLESLAELRVSLG